MNDSVKMEAMVSEWMRAPSDRRAAAMKALKNPSTETPANLTKVVRFSEAAKQLSLSVRGLRYALANSDIVPVRLPGRTRAYGLRAQDVQMLAGE